MKTASRSLLLSGALALAALLPGPGAQAAVSVVNFSYGDLFRFEGPASVDWYNGTRALPVSVQPSIATQDFVQFGRPSEFGIPTLPDGSNPVIMFIPPRTGSGVNPGFDRNQAIQLSPNVGPNGGSAQYIREYSLGYDILFPAGPLFDDTTQRFFSFWNTNDTNANDGEAFVRFRNQGADGIGIGGVYQGTISPDTWHRIAFTVDTNTASMSKYIDGILVGTQGISAGADGRYAVYSDLDNRATLIFGDDNEDTTIAYVSQFMFEDRIWSANEVGVMGGVVAPSVPEPGRALLLLLGALWLTARRRRN